MKKALHTALIGLAIGTLAGCSGTGPNAANGNAATGNAGAGGSSGTETTAEPQIKAPAEFVILTQNTTKPEDFQNIFVNVLSKKFPNTKFTQITPDKNNVDGITKLLASGAAIDLVSYGVTNSAQLVQLDLPLNLEPLARSYGFDLNRISPSALKDIRSYSGKGELLFLPYSAEPFVLNYNKDIFDKFGVPYPKAGSTWDDLIELAKKLTRTEDGVRYRGLDAGLSVNRMQLQLSLPYVQAGTQKSALATDPGWVKLYQTYQQIYSIPGNINPDNKLGNGNDVFTKDRTLAMYPHLLSLTTEAFASAIESGLRMGVTTYPVFKDAPTVSTGFFGNGLSIPRISKNQDFAFQVLAHLMSDEVQTEMSKKGLATALVNPNVQAAYFQGSDIAQAVGLDVSQVFKLQVAAPYNRTEWDTLAQSAVTASLNKLVANKADLNTALREADEAVNKIILENPQK